MNRITHTVELPIERDDFIISAYYIKKNIRTIETRSELGVVVKFCFHRSHRGKLASSCRCGVVQNRM